MQYLSKTTLLSSDLLHKYLSHVNTHSYRSMRPSTPQNIDNEFTLMIHDKSGGDTHTFIRKGDFTVGDVRCMLAMDDFEMKCTRSKKTSVTLRAFDERSSCGMDGRRT